MRAPAEGQGNFALESAIDETAYAVGMDPLDFRLRNYAERHPQSGLPWSSKALLECYVQGAERFGWAARAAEPGSMRDGRWLVGYGLAGVSYPWYQAPCEARASVRRDGSGYVRSAAIDIGTGTYTVMAQLSAELLGLSLDRVRFDLGDSDMPVAPQAGGSGLAGALGNAVHAACRQPRPGVPGSGPRRQGLPAARQHSRRRHGGRRPNPPDRRPVAGRVVHRHAHPAQPGGTVRRRPEYAALGRRTSAWR